MEVISGDTYDLFFDISCGEMPFAIYIFFVDRIYFINHIFVLNRVSNM